MALPSLPQYLLFGVVFGLATVRIAHQCFLFVCLFKTKKEGEEKEEKQERFV